MKLTYSSYNLELKHQFSISYSTRKFTPAVIIKIEDEGNTGYGEASLPPYLKENTESVIKFLNSVKLRSINSLTELAEFTNELEVKSAGDYAAKAALNIALNDLLGKKLNLPCFKLFEFQKPEYPIPTSFTIGLDNDEIIKQKILEAEKYDVLKIKLGAKNDKRIVSFIRTLTNKPLYIDANQGWVDKEFALDMISWLSDKNVVLIEQPMPVSMMNETAWLAERSPLPIIADETVQVFNDIDIVKNVYHGINIKLMKCGGVNEAVRMINSAQENGLKIMLGCMTETSCAISAAAQLCCKADYLDLDGNLLITNDPFETAMGKTGKIFPTNASGLGIKLTKNMFVQQ